jgi:leukotriene-A4 hydrolase
LPFVLRPLSVVVASSSFVLLPSALVPASSFVLPPLSVNDPHSYARPAEARVTHVDLDLHADFGGKVLEGSARLAIEATAQATEIVLDTRGLEIAAVSDSNGAALKYERGAVDPLLGQALAVTLPADRRTIVVRYRTTPSAEALQWLSPEQTAGKKHPYLFSQGQAILTRSWIPTQDSPGIRQTYRARVTVPAPLRAVMSAEALTPEGVATPDGRAFEFRLEQPVPPYLIALAIGDIAFTPVGPRSGVYAEPSVVDRAAAEFVDLEEMIEAAEALGGPYRWGRYDVLVLPPSFPFGGMENPRVTFATPTILAGDRSLTSLIAHELAHSWSGNLVTNATWRDFWLNEGFTTYFENRIMEQLYGVERARMLETLGYRELLAELDSMKDRPGDQVLHIDLTGRNPDDAVGPVAYDKGALFLRTLELAVGRERFDRWLRGYFDRHAFTSLTTDAFLADLRTHLTGNDTALESRLQIAEWLETPGLPTNAARPASEAFERVEQQVRAFAAGTPATRLATASWTTQHWQHFLGSLPADLSPGQLADLDRAFGLSDSGNSEVLFAWLRIAIRHRYAPARPALERFLTSQGRRKFLKPLYEALVKTDSGKAEAKRIYHLARPGYHSVSTTTLDPIVGEP